MFNFDPEELEGIAPHSVQEQYLAKFGFKPPPIPDGFSHESTSMQESQQASQNDFTNNDAGEEKINVLVAKKTNKNKKRVGLSSSSIPSAAIPSASTNGLSTHAGGGSQSAQIIPVHDFGKRAPPASSRAATNFPSPPEQPFADSGSHHRGDWGMDTDMDPAPISAFDASSSSQTLKKNKSSTSGSDGGKGPVYARNLGGNVHRTVGVVKEISSVAPGGVSADALWTQRQQELGLNVPPVMTYLSCEVEGAANDILEVWNDEGGGESFIRSVRYCLSLLMAADWLGSCQRIQE